MVVLCDVGVFLFPDYTQEDLRADACGYFVDLVSLIIRIFTVKFQLIIKTIALFQVKTVFIDGLPASWDEDRVRELLKKYGEVEKVELARNMPSAKRRDFGFVTFDSHDSAVTCAKSINNSELGDGDNKVCVFNF